MENYDTEKIEAAYIAVMVSISNCGAFVSRARTKKCGSKRSGYKT